MEPGVIYQPTSIEDIQEVLRHVNQPGKPTVPIAIRSGGHQYSGASSTSSSGIQLDLKPTFRRPNLDLRMTSGPDPDKAYIRSSVSWELSEFYDFLQDNGVFLPTGQCATVCLGGHIQTGGYGMLARSFGLLGDYIIELEIVDHKGDVVTVTKKSHPDLFYGFLGGSPGNLGVLTHFTVEVQQDKNHKGSHGLWLAFLYNKKTLNNLLDILVEKAQDPNFERNYDFNVNVMSEDINLSERFPGSGSELRRKLPDSIHDGKKNIADLIHFKLPLIIVYAQWVQFGKDQYSPDFFNRLRGAGSVWHIDHESAPGTPMSQITSMWLFKSKREFRYPYVKRTNSTNSTTLSKDKWAGWFSDRIDAIAATQFNGLYVSSQVQVYGGTNSMFRKNASQDTAYSWRDATVVGTWDVFYDNTLAAAQKWQDENDKGALTHFCKDDRRLLWGSYGDWEMKNVWQHYYEPPDRKSVV